MVTERTPQPADYAFLMVLALFWGSAFSFIEIALVSFQPLTIAAGRTGLGAVLLLAFAAHRGALRIPTSREAIYLILAGTAGTALPFALISWAQQGLTSATASILIAFTPIATMLLAQVMTHDERLTSQRLTGGLVGILGVAALVGGPGLADSPWRLLAVVIGAFCYAISGLLFRRVEHLRPSFSACGALLVSATVLIPTALALEQPFAKAPEITALLAVIALGLFPTALATMIMVTLLYRTSATFISFNNFLIPVTGTLIGVFALGEPFSMVQGVGLALILAGLYLARRRAKHA